MTLPLRLLPAIARSKFSKIEVAAAAFREAQAFAHGRMKEIQRIFGMNASLEELERKQLQDELADHENTLKGANERYRAAADLFTNVRAWIERLAIQPPAHALEEAPKIKPPLQKHEGLKACLDRLRGEIAELQSVQQKVAIAPLPAADMKLHAQATVQRLAALVKPTLVMKTGELHLEFFGGGHTAMPPNAAFAFHCAIDPARATKFLENVIDTMPQPNVEPLSAFDKGQRLRELADELLLLERAEEATILALHEEGSVNVTRRPTASPLAILSIQYAKPGSLRPVPRRPTANGANGAAHKPEHSTKHERVRLVPKTETKDARASRG